MLRVSVFFVLRSCCWFYMLDSISLNLLLFDNKHHPVNKLFVPRIARNRVNQKPYSNRYFHNRNGTSSLLSFQLSLQAIERIPLYRSFTVSHKFDLIITRFRF